MTDQNAGSSKSSETPAGVSIEARSKAGETRNVTEAVRALYDLLISSMDFGSDFLSIEDIRPIVELANFCGFKGTEEAVDYMNRQLEAEKRRNCPHDGWVEVLYSRPGFPRYVERTCEQCGLVRVEPR